MKLPDAWFALLAAAIDVGEVTVSFPQKSLTTHDSD